MNLTILLLPFTLVLTSAFAASNDCDYDCKETEYMSYVECIQERAKRSINCSNSIDQSDCQSCDCDFCVVNSCQKNCVECCKNTPPCTTRECCHKTCHSRCKSLSCRSDCRKKCAAKLEVEGFNITTAFNRPRHNVTTIIHIQNTINNTNIIDVPVDINSTNFNNFTVESNDEVEDDEYEDYDEEEEEDDEENCCYVYSPKKCFKIDVHPFTKCVQYRKSICGDVCVAPVMHEQTVRQCLPTPTATYCQERIVYIPQPTPKCSYQSVWPYVVCGLPQNQFCGGCYDHYNTQKIPVECPYSCYDDGFENGPYYRKGPFYRPGYSHTPSCYQIGFCTYNTNNAPVYGSPFYPPSSYEPKVIVHTKPNQNSATNGTSQGFLNIPMFPPHIISGYPYPPPPPIYILPPEVDIQAIITNPNKESNYAQITITKSNGDEEVLHADDL